MKINNLNNFKATKLSNTFDPSFKRAPRADLIVDKENNLTEEQDFELTLRTAKALLGITNLALILHQSSFPIKENDLFIGSHINKAAVDLNKLAKTHGFDSIQLGPPGLTRLSPYESSINSKNYLYSDMEKLTTKPYAQILKNDDIENIIKHVDREHKYEEISDQTNFKKAFYVFDKLYDKAYTNLLKKAEDKDPYALKLKKDFEKFKKEEDSWLEPDAIFQHFKKKFHSYSDDNFFEWPDMNKNLMVYKNDPSSPYHEEAIGYINNIKQKHGKEIDLYKFKQYILDRQEREFIKENPEKLQYISDAIIGFSMMDYWANQDAFLKEYRVGTPYGGEGRPLGHSTMGNNQTWDIPVLDPQKLFVKNEKGEITDLGPAGKLLRKKFANLLDTYQNIRIDHVIGLIDPWVYNKNNVEIKIGRFPDERPDVPEHIIERTAHGANISKAGKKDAYAPETGWEEWARLKVNEDISNMPVLDPDEDYPKIIDVILRPLFEEKGVKAEDMVWESLGCDTPKFKEINDDIKNSGKNPLPEISSAYEWQLQHRQSNPRHKNNWVILGCHDHPPFVQVCTQDFYNNKNCKNGIFEQNYIFGNLYPEISNTERGKLMEQASSWDTRLRVKSKFEEMLRFGQKIQFTFMDFMGLDKTYNHSGSQNDENWKLRLKKDYKKDFYKNLTLKWNPNTSGVDRMAMNMPELLHRAVVSKINNELDADFKKYKPLTDKLEHYKEVLEEPET